MARAEIIRLKATSTDAPTVTNDNGPGSLSSADTIATTSIISVRQDDSTVSDFKRARKDPEDRSQRLRSRALIAVAGGALLLALLLVALAAAIAWRGATPAPPPATLALFPTPTPLVLPTGTAAWSDTARRIVLLYPTAWKKVPPSDSTLRLTARDGTTFLLYDTNFNRSPAEGIAAIQRAHTAETARDYDPDLATRNYTDSPVIEMQIDGEPAMVMPYTYVPKLTPTEAARRGDVWTVAHAGSQYTIQVEYGNAGGNGDVAEIIASLRFIEPPAAGAIRPRAFGAVDRSA